MRDGLEFRESEESARAFDRVNRAENAGERAAVAGIFFEIDQLAVKQVEVFAAFDQKLADDVVTHVETRPRRIAMRCAGDKSRLIRRHSRCLENQMCS
jgi:hypothetical protein